MRLPLLINSKNQAAFGLGVLALTQGAYVFSNRFHFFTPHSLPLLGIDRAIPLVAESIWIYQSIFPLLVSAYFLSRDHEATTKFVYSMLLAVGISIAVFLTFPVNYPREMYPLPETIDSVTRAMLLILRGADTPANCLPSLHVSTCCLAALTFQGQSRFKTLGYFLWTAAVCFSTLTTKQHYFVDVLSGAALATAIYFLFYRKLVLTRTIQLPIEAKRAA